MPGANLLLWQGCSASMAVIAPPESYFFAGNLCLLFMASDELGNRPKSHQCSVIEHRSEQFQLMIASPPVENVR
jgi:hypothetical protein